MTARELLDLRRIDRAEFLAWSEGVIFERTKTAIFEPDEIACKKIRKALKKGETILFTGKDDKVVSFCRKEGKEFVEHPIEELLSEGLQQ